MATPTLTGPARRPAPLDRSTPTVVGHRTTIGGRVADVAGWVVLILVTVAFLLPFYLLIRNGLATTREVTSPAWTVFPKDLQWSNVTALFTDSDIPMLSSLKNSAVVAVLTTLGTLLVCSLAGYALARIPYRFSNAIFYAVLATLMIPAAVTFVPSFVIVSWLGWVWTTAASSSRGCSAGSPCSSSVSTSSPSPRSWRRRPASTGSATSAAFWRIVVPNSGTFIAAIAVITFIASWNAFLWPLVVAQDQALWTVQVTLSTFVTAQTINLHELFLAATVSIPPLVFVFVFLQRYLVQGVAETGIKG